MTSDRRSMPAWRMLVRAALLGIGVACADAVTGVPSAPPVEDVQAQVVAPRAVRVSWTASPEPGVGYSVQRRAGFRGGFVEVGRGPARTTGVVEFIDTTVTSATFYGYRVAPILLSERVGAPSLVRGVETPPAPGVFLQTTARGPAGSAPAAMQLVVLRGDSITQTLVTSASGSRLLSPMRTGSYRIALRGVPTTCAVQGDTARPVAVRDDRGARTLDTLLFVLDCRDPRKSELVARVTVSGVEVDTAVAVRVAGSSTDANAPPAERQVNDKENVTLRGGQAAEYRRTLWPGTYTVTLEDLAPNCTLVSGAVASLAARAGGLDTVALAVSCTRTRPPAPPLSVRPYRVRWSADRPSVRPGDTVTLSAVFDQTAATVRSLDGVEFELRYDAEAFTFLDRVPGDMQLFVSNEPLGPGRLFVGSGSASGPRSDATVRLGGFRFRARAASPRFAGTQTILSTVLSGDGSQVDTSRVWAEEVDVELLAGVAPPTNPPPGGGGGTGGGGTGGGGTGGGGVTVVARANGPYTATAGVPVTFSSAGSTTGTGVTLRWFFPGGFESSQVSPQFTFATAGSYVVRLEVTQSGTTARDSAVVTVAAPPTGGGGGGTGGGGGGTGGGTPPPPSGSGPTLYYTLSAPTIGSGGLPVTTMTIYLNLSADVPATTGPEVLGGWSMSLRFDPAVLEWRAGTIRTGQWHNQTSSPSQDQARQGVLQIAATTTPGQPNRTGLITLARLDFNVIGARGASMTTQTALGSIVGAGEVGGFNYTPLIAIQELVFVVP